MNNPRVYLVEVKVADGRWVPMYQPCYTIPEAVTKIKRRKKYEAPARIGMYVRADVEVKG